MAISPAQVEFITASIEHLLDFPADFTALKAAVAALKRLLYSPLSAVDQTAELYPLCQSLMLPQEVLQRLENYNNESDPNRATVAEVQEFVLSAITASITHAAQQTGHTARDAHWKSKKIRKLFDPENYNSYFVTQISQPVTIQPWENIHCEGAIYRSALQYNEHAMSASLTVHTELPHGTVVIRIPQFRLTPFSILDEERELLELIQVAEAEAMQIAERLAYDHLCSTQSMPRINADSARQNPYFIYILTNEYYFSQLANENIDCTPLLAVNGDQCFTLLLPIVQSLIRNNLCTLQQAMQLSENEVRACTNFYAMLAARRLKIKDILGITDTQASMLQQPLMINLINSNNLPFAIAKELPSGILLLLRNQIYSDYFLRKPTDLAMMGNHDRDTLSFLARREVANLIKNDILSPTDPLLRNVDYQKCILNRRIYQLLLTKKIQLADIVKMQDRTIDLIDGYEEIYNGIMNGIITFQELNTLNLTYNFIIIYGDRLATLCDATPARHYTLPDSSDSVEKIYANLVQCATRENEDTQKLLKFVVKHVMLNFLYKITVLLNDYPPPAETLLLNKLKSYIGVNHNFIYDPQLALQGLMETAQNYLTENRVTRSTQRAKITDSQLVFFPPRQHPTIAKVENFCKSLFAIDALTTIGRPASAALNAAILYDRQRLA